MFPSFISILDIQSWWEVPSIAHFCSLFRAAFNLLDFDIEELEEALLTDGTEDSGSSLLQELIVRLLCGCLANNDVSTFNYQMFLRRLFRQKCQEHGRYNPFNTDIDFQFLPLRTKVEILHALCDFRLDADDVLDLLKNLEAESLRVEPLGYDDNDSAYWYFYGTRLYREDYEKGSKKSKHKKSVWQVVCFTEQDWNHLTLKFKGATSKTEKALYRSLSENFLPEIPRLFQEKERQQRKRLLELQPRRSSSRVQKLRAQHEEVFNNEITAAIVSLAPENEKTIKADLPSARELRAIQRDACKSGSGSGSGSGSESESCTQSSTTMPTQKSNSALTSVGRQTNNSLASATGQILIQTSSQRKKLKTSQVFRQTEEDLQTGMYKILEYVKNHDDAWPFIEPVEEDYAPNYYSIVRKPMDLQRMEDKLDAGEYLTFSRFKADFQLIVDNCRLYNGTDNEYTEMVDNLQQAFQRATDRFLDQITSSDEEIAVEFQGSSKENVTTNKKPKRGRKENKTTVKRNSSPSSCIEAKPSKVMRKKHNKLKNSPLVTNNETDKKIKPTKKEKIKHKDKDKDKNTVLNANSNISPRKNNKKKNASQNSVAAVVRDKSRSRTRSRSRSNIRGWTSSPSPPPPRIQKKKKNKEKNTKLATPVDNVNVENTDKLELKEIKVSEPKTPKKIFNLENENIKKENSQLNETIEKLKKNNLAKKEHVVNKKQKIRDKNKERLKKLKIDNKEKLKENKVSIKSDSEEMEMEMETESTNTKDSSTTISDSKKIHPKKVKKAGIIKNPAAIKALDLATEQTLKDINKWLDDTPKFSEINSPSNSPLPLSNLDDFDVAASNLETEYKLNQQKQIQKPVTPVPPPPVVKVVKEHAKDTFKRRPPHKDIHKLQKRRDFQRTIDRLQPGKSKGNLIANIQSNKTTEDPTFPPITTLNKLKETKNAAPAVDKESTPKLSLGTVLDSFGQQHNFVDNKKESEPTAVNVVENELKKEDTVETVEKDTEGNTKFDKETTTTEEDNVPLKLPKQENVTPNLSAWFKAFGAPKSSSVQKKKTDPELDTSKEAENVVSPISADENRLSKPNCELVDDTKKMSSPMPSPAPDITIGLQPVPRMRKASTGSTVSERSSFSQDMTDPLDSPRLSVDERLGMYSAPYPSPLHRSPIGVSPVMTSPHMDDGQRSASYPPLNGNIRVGFYQDTVKSSPEKSCSPRDQSQSPHPQYSQHVYIPPTSSTYQYNNPPSQSPVHSQSPAQSPIHSQSGVPPPPYNSNHMIANTFFEASKPMEYESVKSPCGNNVPPTSAMSPPPGSPKQFESGNSAQSQRTVENKSHMNTIIPVKKRLYNENPDVEQISRLSSPLPPPQRDLNIQNIPRIHEMNIFNNREIDANLIPPEHLNLPNPEQLNIPNKTFIPSNAQTLETSLSITPSTVAKNFISTNTLCDISNRTLDNTHIINVANRGLNLQIPSTEPLNIPTPMKTIDLTGPDSPVYQQPLTMNMPLELGTIKHNSRNSENLYQKIPSSAAPSNIEMAQIPQYSRHDSSKTHDAISQTESLPSVSSTVAFSTGRPVSVDLNMHNSRINLASADLRIPTMRTADNGPQNSNQEINTTVVSQRNEFSHQNLRSAAESRLSIPPGINIDLTSTSVSNSHAFNANPTTIGLDPTLLRGNLANLSHIVDRYQNDERLLSTLATGNPYYTDKGLVTAQSLFPKTIPTSIHTPVSNSTSTHSILSQPNLHINSSTSSINYAPSTQPSQQTVKSTSSAATLQVTDKKIKKRKSKTASPVTTVTDVVNAGFQTYAGLKSNPATVVSTEPSAISLKTTSVVPGSAFNFGPAATNLGLTTGIYNDKDNFAGFLDEYRNPTTNYYMAAAAAVVHHGTTPEMNADKSQRSVAPPPAPNPTSSTFTTYLGHPQTRPTTYSPFMNPHQPSLIETSSPIYQQYLQRHQEELLRHSGVLHQSLLGSPTAYPPGYPLGMRQPFDTMNRPSWL